MEKKKILIYTAIAVVAITAAITYTIGYNVAMHKFNKVVAEVNERQSMYSKLSEVDQIVRQDYVNSIDEDKIKEGICEGYVSSLDNDLAFYLNSDEYKFYSVRSSDKSAYIGANFIENSDGNLEVVSVDSGSAAEESEIKVGDIVTSVDNKDIKNLNFEKDELYFWNTVGSKCKLEILRDNTSEDGNVYKENISIEVTYKKYQPDSVKYRVLEESNVGYVSINNFTSHTAVSFDSAMIELNSYGIEQFVLDLRNCKKGEVQYVAEIINRLVPEGNTISRVDKDGNKQVLYTSNSNEFKYPITLLINDQTKGAAEILVSAFKDAGKGEIVGQTTNGFGVEEEVYSLSDGSALSLAIAHYETTNSGIFTGVGISPTKEVIISDQKRYELDRNKLAESDDDQLQVALEVLGAKAD